jgi:hypothetical protein
MESKKVLWTGRILSALPGLFLVWDASLKVIGSPWVDETMTRLGWPDVSFALGAVELLCVVLYLVPRTAVLGAVLLTAWLGGAIATHVRVGDPFVFPIVFGCIVWAGVYLRNRQLRALVPFSV